MAVKIVSQKRRFWDQLYLPSIVKGLKITLGHFFANLFGNRKIETIRYGEWDFVEPKDPGSWRGKKKQRDLPPRHRGLHRLMKRSDGEVRCTACMMCATVCPANCIRISASERFDPKQRSIEKFPATFEIDELLCVVCGLCVEACPCDALRMDSHVFSSPVERREDALLNKEDLMKRGGISLAVDGGSGPEWMDQYTKLGKVRQIYNPETIGSESEEN